MDPITYCRQKAAPDGSSLYYALLFAPSAQKNALLALAAYRAEILEIPREVSDPGVGSVKIQWWQEELQRLRDGQPRHPVTQALQTELDAALIHADGLDEVIAASQMDLEYGRYPTLRELTLYCHRAGGAVADLAWRLGSCTGKEAAPFAHDLAMGLELTRMLRHLRRDILAGRLYLPEDELIGAGLDSDALLRDPSGTEQQALLQRQGERAKRFLDSAIAQLPTKTRTDQRFGLVLAVLYRELLATLARDHYPVLERRHHLTPVRKLWLAWKTAKRPGHVRPLAKDPAA